ncbi:hypothetical protein [Roseixanthobacter glucoisosaccharinicivorans]|uniref:hypothetical protein n=1 Tax=Roseixanthobacter glucoisosaccharinicivorans TaxID=3119923 RepID=UPI00372B36A1
MATALRDGVRQLETTARICLMVLALASGVYTYIGVRDLLDGGATAVFFAAIIYSVAVSVGIYAFWTFMMRFLPHVEDAASRALMFGAMALGSLMIVAMCSWLNASALAGSAAIEQHMGRAIEDYDRALEENHGKALAAQGLAPDIAMAAARFSQLADAERTGSLTGTTGSGTVVQLLTQMASQLGALSKEVAASGDKVKEAYDQGAKHLATMRELASGSGRVTPRADAFGGEATALAGVLTALQQASIAPAVKRAATDFASGFIAPAADGRSPDVVGRQNEVVGRVQGAVAAQSKALAGAADKVIQMPAYVPPRFAHISPAEAVLRYASDFIPSWAGAISIDLLPAVLVFILCIVHASLRREGQPQAGADTMTAGELLAALRMARAVELAHADLRAPLVPDLAATPAAPQRAEIAEPAEAPHAEMSRPAAPQPVQPPEPADEEKVTTLHGHGLRPAKRD